MSVSADRLRQVFEAVALERTGSRGQREALIYQDLKLIARRISGKVQPGATLATTALLHEAWERLAGADLSEIHQKRQFLALAATIMHRVAVDHVRGRVSKKRGGGSARVPLDEAWQQADNGEPDELLLQLHEGLTQLKKLAPDLAELTEQLFFVGLTQKEIAELRGVAEITVRRDWRKARAWLYRHLGDRS
ncbi:MAG: ECF-type sigma factor [Pseudomonadota bacterium]